MRLPEEQARLLRELAACGAALRIDEIAERLQIDQARIAAAAVILRDAGFLRIEEEAYREVAIRPEGRRFAREGFPERKILGALHEAGGSLSLADAARASGLEAKEVGGALRYLAAKAWAAKEGASLRALANDPPPSADELLLAALEPIDRAAEERLRASGVPVEEAFELLKGRASLCEVREKTIRRASLEEAGRAAVEAGIDAAREVNQLTPELIAGGGWRDVTVRPYDVRLPAETIHPGKRHPLQRVLDETRRVYIEMGFEEIVSPLVESAFWDFDVLFQPQDHPAREMQDTFYLERPASIDLPADRGIVDAVRAAHEDGGTTGSIGWQYRWDPAVAQRAVLRTHTTATTVRALAADPIPPRRVFSVGRVFRRETIDYKHLPIFFQVDGIVIDADASFANLLGTLSAFYRKMGFEQFQFRPAFFPYTEPSVEVYIWYEKRKDWVEMGGAGIFRPEVTEPLGCKHPVLAWGLGLERIAMMRYDLADIRDLYMPSVEWLKGVALCQ